MKVFRVVQISFAIALGISAHGRALTASPHFVRSPDAAMDAGANIALESSAAGLAAATPASLGQSNVICP